MFGSFFRSETVGPCGSPEYYLRFCAAPLPHGRVDAGITRRPTTPGG